MEKKSYNGWNVKYRMIKICNIRNSIKEDWDKSGDIYNKDIYKEDIVAGIKALRIGLKKNMSLC